MRTVSPFPPDRAGPLLPLLAACHELLAIDDPVVSLRRTVELLRDVVGLRHLALFVFDHGRNMMLGTWGTDLQGRLVDHGHLAYELGSTDCVAFRRVSEDGVHFTAFDDFPVVEHGEHETRVVGRGWVACTPIRAGYRPSGILWNDAGLSADALDEEKQMRAAIICTVAAAALDPVRGTPGRRFTTPPRSEVSTVAATVGMLAKDPSLVGKQIADTLGISRTRLARAFRDELRMSLVEYRNRLRMERFFELFEPGLKDIHETARTAGFGSYSQFDRVFRATQHLAPRAYMRRARERRTATPLAAVGSLVGV